MLSQVFNNLLLQTDFAFEDEHTDYLMYGIYYGIALMAIIINTTLYIIFKDKKILLYILLLSAIVMSMAYSDGVFSVAAPQKKPVVLELLCHFLIGLSAAFMAIHFVKDQIQSKKVVAVALTFLPLAAVLYVTSIITGSMMFNFYADALLLVMLGILLVYNLIFIKNDKPKQYLLLSYIPLYIAALDYYLLRPLQLSVFNTVPAYLKTTSIIGIVAFIGIVLNRIYIISQKYRTENIIVNDNIIETVSVESAGSIINENSLESLCALYGLTDAEMKVFKCIAAGMSNSEISGKLFISVNTVKYHNRNIYEKLDIKSKSQAVSKILSLQLNVN
jgi:DNA-binding CsgD family transcriptional regulator